MSSWSFLRAAQTFSGLTEGNEKTRPMSWVWPLSSEEAGEDAITFSWSQEAVSSKTHNKKNSELGLTEEEPCKYRALLNAKNSANLQFIVDFCLEWLGWSVFFERLLSCQPWRLCERWVGEGPAGAPSSISHLLCQCAHRELYVGTTKGTLKGLWGL